MHENNLTILKKEAVRICNAFKEIVQSTLDNHDVNKSLDQDQLTNQVKHITNEILKLNESKMVLAIVGTMKAGKSTTINAIIGKDVVPNRNRPMTTLPTQIEHSLGIDTPELIFAKISPIINLCRKIKEQKNFVTISNQLQNTSNKEIEGFAIKDMHELINFVEEYTQINQSNTTVKISGSDNIHHFLKTLNDLARLTAKMGLEFPYEDYENIDDLPVIKVEFLSLKEHPQRDTKLILLDTPGANEAGESKHLRKILKNQLRKASGVVAVLDYTQLNSEADHELRDEVKKVIELNNNAPFYVFVNKFDSKDSKSDDAETTKMLVSNNLMKNHVTPDNVYPVSSQLGYLAQRGKDYLDTFNRLPPYDEDWVQDLAKKILRADDVEEYSDLDIDDYTKQINKGWKKSRFAEPLANVIGEIYQNASLHIIGSACDMIKVGTTEISNAYNITIGSLQTDIENLQKIITELETDISVINTTHTKTQAEIDAILNSLDNDIATNVRKGAEGIEKELVEFFKTGKKRQEDLEKQEAATSGEKKRKHKVPQLPYKPLRIFENVFNFFNPTRDENEVLPSKLIDSGKIEYTKRSDADKLINEISHYYNKLSTELDHNVRDMIQLSFNNLLKQFGAISGKCEQQLINCQKRLSSENFTLDIPSPKRRDLSFMLDTNDIMDNLIQEEVKQVTRSRRKSGIWGTICRWFNTDEWGWESYTEDQDTYVVDLKELKDCYLGSWKNLQNNINSSITSDIKQPLHNDIEEYFVTIKDIVEKIRGDFIAATKSHEQNCKNKELVVNSLGKYQKQISILITDNNTLQQNIVN